MHMQIWHLILSLHTAYVPMLYDADLVKLKFFFFSKKPFISHANKVLLRQAGETRELIYLLI